LQMQFIVLFGRSRSNIIENRVMEDVNPIPYFTYVREVNEIWGSALFREPRLFHKGMIHDYLWHPRMRRKINRRASIRITEILGPDWQKREEEKKSIDEEPTTEVKEDAAFRNLKKTFEAQELAPDPSFAWMYEASLDTTAPKRSGGRVRRRRVRVVRSR